MSHLGPKPGTQKRKNKLNTSGLGRSLVNQRSKGNQNLASSSMFTTDVSSDKLRSVTQERPLDEFLSTAELADRDFTAERASNVTIVQAGGRRLAATGPDRNALARKHYENAGKLTVPRRPRWTREMTSEELDRLEREAFLNWRRSLAQLQDNEDLLLTPFERNIEVWRQLWRVVERSDVVIQIVDARNPLLYRSEDLDTYVHEVDPSKTTLLLVNKADMLSSAQRDEWRQYFQSNSINFAFFSAKTSLAGERLSDVLSVEQLESLFWASSPKTSGKLQVGLVGYPNVGKSSTINALIGSKKVSVSATPGKTKHFQTIDLTPEVTLCDCPGLVFPNFARTKADLVCNGVLPIDQLREHFEPVAVVCENIPKYFIEALYGINMTKSTPEEFLGQYARRRNLMRSGGGGGPDTSRAARAILKDYVDGKLLYCEPPPDRDGTEFNKDKYGLEALPESRRGRYADNSNLAEAVVKKKTSEKVMEDDVDADFFGGGSSLGHASKPFHQRNTTQTDKKHFKGRKSRR